MSRAINLNHVSVCADDLGTSIAWYRDMFGMEPVPTPSFGFPVQWLRVGERQFHLFERPGLAPAYHHVGLTVDEVEPIYALAKEQGCLDSSTFAGHLLEIPGDCVQLYLRDPAGNLVEVNAPGASRLPDSIKADMIKLATLEPQSEENLRARLFLVAEPPAL